MQIYSGNYMKNGKSIAEILSLLRNDSRFKERIEYVEVINRKPAEFGRIEEKLPANIEKYLTENKLRLYKHQSEAVNLLRNGNNVIIDTPTASGKTLAFNLPVLERMHDDKSARALYLYPTKALSNDQLKVIEKMEKKTGIQIEAAVYDGDTPQGLRPNIRKKSRLIISNPYELHQVLAWHFKWEDFLSNLQFVVIDEAHRYRGVFGSNVSFLLDRFRRICRLYGAEPQYVISTATLANPIDFSTKLTGREFELISEDGSPRSKKYFILYNPYYDGIGKYSTHTETKDLFRFFIENKFQTLCFTRSRKMAEAITSWTKEELKERNEKLAERVTSYRAGYLPSERRVIENRLKEGDLLGVVSTNALELGIDIGSLDVVLISGYPGTVISTWQQAGRAGRGMDESAAFLIAFQEPMNQYFMKNPEHFFKKPHENAIINRSNPHIISGHIMCATSEYPFNIDRDSEYFGNDSENILNALEKENLVRETPNGWVYTGRKRPAEVVSLDNISSDIFKVVHEGKLLETKDLLQVYREAHQGAIILHQGETYVVEEIDFTNNTVKTRKEDVDYFTQPLDISTVNVQQELNSKRAGEFSIHFGYVNVEEDYRAYKVMKYGETISVHKLNLPPVRFNTMSMWITIPYSIKERIWERRKHDEDIRELINTGGEDTTRDNIFHGGIHALEHGMIGIMPFIVMCDREDIGGVSGVFHRDTELPTVFIYDGFEGGIGLTEKAYDCVFQIFEMTDKMISSCKCSEGCPGCIYSPKCGNQNEPLDKKAVLLILKEILSVNNDI